ncbi:pectinesterase family protein [Marinimicrobium agarilyticum]|uniref:pectinesterase family protein n=1 Tax=Marinimicrobium agarilyticum TaxID=306546 RepID=UPI000428075C|nr:pectinesterase family protein [Marinimicrobium agarilyticum]
MKAFLLFLVVWSAVVLPGCDAAGDEFHAVVDEQGETVNGLPVFTSIEAALKAAPADRENPYRILIRAGEYREKLLIDKPNIHLVGEGIHKTRIHYDDYAGKPDGEGAELGTFRSFVVKVTSTDVHFYHLSIENRFDFPANDARSKEDPARVSGSQAVALHLDKGSDRVLARDVQLLGHQDTLYANGHRAWFDQSRIAGNVDFIFGAGNVVFTDTEIVTTARGKVHDTHGYVTAPSTNIDFEFGFTFINCDLTHEPSVPEDSVSLGRPWHPTTTFPDGRYANPDAIGKSVFIGCRMAAHIKESGWSKMGGTAPNGKRIYFYPEDSRFFEYGSEGPGAHRNESRRRLSGTEVKQYTLDRILGDWDPQKNGS